MQEETIIWGIIGCGDVAEVKSGPAFQKCDSSELLAVMRRLGLKAKDFAKRHQVPLWYDNASQLLKNNDINAVYIATPPSTHLDYTIESLEAGKYVYLEKPMVPSEKEALVLQAAVKKSNKKLVVAHYRRQLPMYLKIKTLIDKQAIGNIEYIDLKYLKPHDTNLDANWRLNPTISGGGIFHDIAPHQIDLMYHFFGDYISAKGFSANQKEKYEVCDMVDGTISFKNGIQFNGIWNFKVQDCLEEDICTIHGSQGMISFSFFGNEFKLTSNNETNTYNFINPINIQQPFIQQTINYFLGKQSNPCSVKEGTIVARIMDAFTNTIKQ